MPPEWREQSITDRIDDNAIGDGQYSIRPRADRKPSNLHSVRTTSRHMPYTIKQALSHC
jgi:hypothetical protein